MLFLFDENFSPNLAGGLALIESANTRSPVQVEIKHTNDFMGGAGSSDTDIIAAAAGLGAVIFTKDSDFKRIKHYHELYREHQVGVVFFRSTKQRLTYWDEVVNFINRWESLKTALAEARPPMAFQLTLQG